MKVNWFLNKDEESGDVYIFVSGDRARCMKTKEIMDAVQHIDYGSTANEIKLVCRGSSEGKRFLRSMWDPNANSDFTAELGKCASNADFIKLLTDTSNVEGPRSGRVRSPVNSPSPAAKKRRISDVTNEDTEPETCENIKSKQLGRFSVDISQLHTPPKKLLVRPVCKPFVESIKKELVVDQTKLVTILTCFIDPESVPNKANFQSSSVKQYKLYTLGGNHLRTACRELKAEGKLADVQNCVDVDLFVDLTDTEARYLGNKHNIMTKGLPVSFTDKVRQARRLIYEMTDRSLLDDEPPEKTPPNFMKNLLVEWAMKDKNVGSLSTVKHVALYSSKCWKLFEQIADNIEQRGAHPAPLNQTQFQHFQGIEESLRYELLKRVLQGELSLTQAGAQAKLSKQLHTVRTAFVSATNSPNWEYAKKRYPDYTTDERLKQFVNHFIVKRGPNKENELHHPDDFIRYCNAARLNINSDSYKVTIQIENMGMDVTMDPDFVNLIETYKNEISKKALKIKEEKQDPMN